MKLCNTKKLLNVCKLNIPNLAIGVLCLLVLELVLTGFLDIRAGLKKACAEQTKSFERML